MRIRKTFKFEAAHRLMNSHTERCQGIHGHSYRVEFVIDGEVNLLDGMVLDFTLMKNALGAYVDMFDHALILYKHDPLTNDGMRLYEMNPRYIIFPQHPTAEMMAAHFFFVAYERLASHRMKVLSVRVHETDTGYAECRALDQSLIVADEWKEIVFSDKCRTGK